MTSPITNQTIDLAFLMDCTSSMSSYIAHAKDNINKIADELIASEKCRLRIALVEYRDHPPQDNTFITRVNNFTEDIKEAKSLLQTHQHAAEQVIHIYYLKGDLPESICCALYESLNNLNWNADSVKIAIIIADAPVHGLHGVWGDGFPNGCPAKNDPVEIVHKMAERAITLYCAGCEPALTPYRGFFAALALITGGKYVPLDHAENLSNVIIGGTREEVSMEKLMTQVHEEVMKEAADKGEAVNEDELTRRIHEVLNSQGSKANKVKVDNLNEIEITEDIKEMSKLKTLKEVSDYMKDHPDSKNTKTTFGGSLFTSTTTIGRGKPSGRGKTKKTKSTTKKTTKKVVKKAPSPPKDVAKAAVEEKKVDDKTTSSTKTETKAKDTARKGIRRSTRIAFNNKEDALDYIEKTGGDTDLEEEDNPEEEVPKKKPKLTKIPSTVSVTTDEKIDIDQARRLVKKSMARNKLKK